MTVKLFSKDQWTLSDDVVIGVWREPALYGHEEVLMNVNVLNALCRCNANVRVFECLPWCLDEREVTLKEPSLM